MTEVPAWVSLADQWQADLDDAVLVIQDVVRWAAFRLLDAQDEVSSRRVGSRPWTTG